MFSLFSRMLPRNRHVRPLAPLASGGFGLVELLVSISIIVFITSLVLVRQSSFNGAVLLRSQAYEVALRAREVQLFAVSIVGESGDFRNTYGVHFDSTVTSNPFYRVFRDADGDNYYDSDEEFGTQGFLDTRFEIRELRVVGGPSDGTTPNSVSVVFERPNFDARFFSAANADLDANRLEIDIARVGSAGSGNGDVRTVEIGRTGQISVQ